MCGGRGGSGSQWSCRLRKRSGTPMLKCLCVELVLFVAATDNTPPEVGGRPAHCVVSECGVRE